MSKDHPLSVALLSCAVAAFLLGAAVPSEPTYGEDVYVNCQYRFAAHFPNEPMTRDITHSNGGRSVPARQFYMQQGADSFSVTIADFSNGPAVDAQIVENAAVPIRRRGEVRFQFAEDYDPGIPGRQLNIYESNGRQHRASVYMWDHRLYITEANASPGDFSALQFEQSITVLDANGTDLDKNGNAPSRQYNCGR
jgi:hypothetical protein